MIDDILVSAIGRSGIYFERGVFERGTLRSAELRDDGYLEIVVEIGTMRQQRLGSDSVEVTDQSLLASGYVSWGWIHGDRTIAEVERRIFAKGCDGDVLECYKIARTIDSRPAIIAGERFNLPSRDH